MENHKYEVSNYKTKKLVKVPDSEHIIVKNTHEAIISEEDFEIVNNMIKSRISPRIHESENLFKSIVYCEHCGNRMVLTHQTRNSNYVSQTYKCHKHNRDIDLCPEPNNILYSELKQVVLMDLKVLAKKINRETFIYEKPLYRHAKIYLRVFCNRYPHTATRKYRKIYRPSAS